MSNTCDDCGRGFALTEEQWLESHGPDGYPNGPLCGMAVDMGPSECRIHTIRRLKARVKHLEGELENFDTVHWENHAVRTVVNSLNRILDERRQVGTFGDPLLQTLTDRVLELQRGYFQRIRGT